MSAFFSRASLKTRRGISPVIVIVIMTAVTVTIAISAAFWTSGIVGIFVKLEKLEVQSAKCVKDGNGNWNITVKIKNTGTTTTTLLSACVNEVEVDTYGASEPTEAVSTITTNMTAQPSFTIGSGQTRDINIWVGAEYLSLSSGTAVNIKLQSSGGKDYMKLVSLA